MSVGMPVPILLLRGCVVLTAAAGAALIRQSQARRTNGIRTAPSDEMDDALQQELKSRPSQIAKQRSIGKSQEGGTSLVFSKGAAILHVVLLTVMAALSVWRGTWLDCVLITLMMGLVIAGEPEVQKRYRAIMGIPEPEEKPSGKSKTPAVSPEVKAAMDKVDRRIAGSWLKVHELSEDMGPSIQLLQLNGLAKKAVCLFKGMELKLHEDGFLEMGVFSVIPFLKVSSEKYSLTGQSNTYPRRDLRKGEQYGSARVEEDGSVSVCLHWDPPFGGEAKDEVKLQGPNELHVTTTLKVGTKTCKYTVVYNRDTEKK